MPQPKTFKNSAAANSLRIMIRFSQALTSLSWVVFFLTNFHGPGLVKECVGMFRSKQLEVRTSLVLALGFGVLVLMQVVTALAQGGPPMITDDTGTVPKGHFEINTAFTMEFTNDGHLWGTPLIDFNYGTSKNTQLKVEIPYLIQKNFGQPQFHALGNTNIGVRWRFKDMNEDKRTWAISVYPQFEFNTPGSRARALGIEDRGPMFLLPFQFEKKLNKDWSFNGDVGWRFKRGEDEAIYGGVFGREYKKADLLFEMHATSPAGHWGDTEAVFNIGTRIPMTKNATFIGSAGRSFLGSRDPQFIGYVGIQWTF